MLMTLSLAELDIKQGAAVLGLRNSKGFSVKYAHHTQEELFLHEQPGSRAG